MFQHEHEAHGVQFHLGDGVTALVGENGNVSSVELKSGKTLAADFVVVGVGVVPATEFLRDFDIVLDEKDGSVHVDTRLQTSHPYIYAAGDIARWGDGGVDGSSTGAWHSSKASLRRRICLAAIRTCAIMCRSSGQPSGKSH